MAADMLNALAPLRLGKSDRLESTPEGVVIHQRGKPALLLTHEAARDFNNMMEEARNA
jgi:hypothetical protein